MKRVARLWWRKGPPHLAHKKVYRHPQPLPLALRRRPVVPVQLVQQRVFPRNNAPLNPNPRLNTLPNDKQKVRHVYHQLWLDPSRHPLPPQQRPPLLPPNVRTNHVVKLRHGQIAQLTKLLKRQRRLLLNARPLVRQVQILFLKLQRVRNNRKPSFPPFVPNSVGLLL